MDDLYGDARHYTNKLLDILAEAGEDTELVISLLNYLSDDEVRDFAESNGYFDEDFEDEDEDEDDDENYDYDEFED